jgi:hypothetical protein
MYFATADPESPTAAANTLSGIGSAMSAQNAAAATPTSGVLPAAADEVSAFTAAQLAAHAEMYQAIGAQAMAIHQFVSTSAGSAVSYPAAEVADVAATG